MTKEQIQQLPTPKTDSIKDQSGYTAWYMHARSIEQQLESMKMVAEVLHDRLAESKDVQVDEDCRLPADQFAIENYHTTISALEEINNLKKL